MAFNNATVLRAILDTCEPDTAIRDASMGVSGLPLEHAFQVNENLNYLEQFVGDDLESFHALINEEVGYDKTEEAFKALASFNTKLSVLYNKYECIRNYDVEPAADEYLRAWFKNGVDSYYSEAIRSVKYFASDAVTYLNTDSSLKKKISRVASLYRTHLFSSLVVLARGAFMDENTPEVEVNAWLEVFALFSNVVDFYNELDLIINEGL
jgi:hypothetical protein